MHPVIQVASIAGRQKLFTLISYAFVSGHYSAIQDSTNTFSPCGYGFGVDNYSFNIEYSGTFYVAIQQHTHDNGHWYITTKIAAIATDVTDDAY